MVTDATGQVLERQSFDAFGTRRFVATWRDPVAALTGLFSTRGFTGHEQLDAVGLIHMNGRVYDPQLGRFLSADPMVQHLAGAQGLNRYSYTDNNPLSRVDPSGYGWLSKAWKKVKRAVKKVFRNPVVRAVAAVAASVVTFGYAGLLTSSPFWGAAAGGFVGGTIATGTLKGGLVGAFTAGAFYGVGSWAGAWHWSAKTLVHGVVGGTSSAASGGRFKSGFMGAGFTQFASPTLGRVSGDAVGRTVAAAVVGGTAAELGGGKFANGAVTGAFSRLFAGGGLGGQGNSSGGGFFRGALDVVGRIWALPNTIIGAAYGGAGMLFGATPVWDSAAGILRFTNMPGWLMPSAMSFGHVQVFGPGAYKNPDGTFALNRFDIPIVREETLHTRQAEILGPLYLPLHGISMGTSILTGGGTHNNNLLEYGPERGTGPWP